MEFKLRNVLVRLVEDYSPKRYSIVLAAPIVLFVIGYVIWAVYLYSYGVSELEIFDNKYIITGVGFILFTVSGILLLEIVLDLLGLINSLVRLAARKVRGNFNPNTRTLYDLPNNSKVQGRRIINHLKIVIITYAAIFWFFFYVLVIFPIVPTFIGGGQPASLALIASKDDLEVLTTFGIAIPEGATYQTENLCVFNENGEGVYVFLEDRILKLDQALINGYVSLPGPNAVNQQTCISLARTWAFQGFKSSMMLFGASLANVAFKAAGLPELIIGFFVLQPETTTSEL